MLVSSCGSFIASRRISNVISFSISFCAFTGPIENARKTIREKIIKKGCDYMFANPIDIPGQGFGPSVHNEGWLFDKIRMETHIPKTSKIDIANKIITQIISVDK